MSVLSWRSVCLLLFIEAAYSSGTQYTFVLPVFTCYVQPRSARKKEPLCSSAVCYTMHWNLLRRKDKAKLFFSLRWLLNQQSHWWHRCVFIILSNLHPESPSTVYPLPFVLGWWEVMVLWFAPANKGLMYVSREVTRMAAPVVRDLVWHCDRMCNERLLHLHWPLTCP